jgi:hypothetical protein
MAIVDAYPRLGRGAGDGHVTKRFFPVSKPVGGIDQSMDAQRSGTALEVTKRVHSGGICC